MTRTLIAKSPKTAPEAPTETALRGRTNHETRFAPAPVRTYETHKPKLPSSSSTSFPVGKEQNELKLILLLKLPIGEENKPIVEKCYLKAHQICRGKKGC